MTSPNGTQGESHIVTHGESSIVGKTVQASSTVELDPTELVIETGESVDRKLPGLLEQLGDVEFTLPHGIKLPALGGVSDSDIANADPEPVYDASQRSNIQGNIVPGFNKDHQEFLFFRLGATKPAKKWLHWIGPMISSMDEVLAFVRAHRAMRLRLGVNNPPMCSSWVNIAFSHQAIATLASRADADAFGDESFRQGLSERSTYLGDPSEPAQPGHRNRWVVGGPGNEAHILVIVAADHPQHLDTLADAIKREAGSHDLTLLFSQRGDTLPGRLRGHEHFGFKDGVSQPGIRGKASAAPGDYITPRIIDPADARARYFAKPGQMLAWPGEFLLGEPRQSSETLLTSGPRATNFPHWGGLGSYLVCRRLLQDVPAFWRFAIGAGLALGISPEKFAAQLVGRWRSGAPLMRTPTGENAALARDEWANNHFIFNDDTRPIPLHSIPGYAGDNHPAATQDLLGIVCPHYSHIRKMNPRDSATDLGNPQDTMLRTLLRRGIPFGPPLVGAKRPTPTLLKAQRGLMFISYGSTVEQQFEFITRRWANSTLQPNVGGHDPIIGQHDGPGTRIRTITVPIPNGGRKAIKLSDEWVIPSGGGYFFAPPITAISGVLGS